MADLEPSKDSTFEYGCERIWEQYDELDGFGSVCGSCNVGVCGEFEVWKLKEGGGRREEGGYGVGEMLEALLTCRNQAEMFILSKIPDGAVLKEVESTPNTE